MSPVCTKGEGVIALAPCRTGVTRRRLLFFINTMVGTIVRRISTDRYPFAIYFGSLITFNSEPITACPIESSKSRYCRFGKTSRYLQNIILLHLCNSHRNRLPASLCQPGSSNMSSTFVGTTILVVIGLSSAMLSICLYNFVYLPAERVWMPSPSLVSFIHGVDKLPTLRTTQYPVASVAINPGQKVQTAGVALAQVNAFAESICIPCECVVLWVGKFAKSTLNTSCLESTLL